MAFAIKPGQTVVFTGDSITDCGRRAHAGPLGEGYVRMAHDLITARHPKHKLAVINTGISGHTARDLFNRWTDDVIRHRPDWLSIMIGINDLHMHLKNMDTGVSPEQYAEYYDKILTRARKETKAQIVLIDPFYISIDRAPDSWRTKVLEILPRYRKTVKAMVKKHKARHVPAHEAFQTLITHHSPDRFAPEPVHPNPTGHLVIAHEWLKVMGW